MSNKLIKVKVKETGKIIEVYQSRSLGTWIDYADCTTQYEKKALQFDYYLIGNK